MYDSGSSSSRRPPRVARGDTPIDMIRYSDRGHVPANAKKVRSVVGKSNRHEADPSTNGRNGYRSYTPGPAPAAFNRTINNSTTFRNSMNTTFGSSANNSSAMLLASEYAGVRGGNNASVGDVSAADATSAERRAAAAAAGGGRPHPYSITPTSFLHSTRPASSLAHFSAAAIPSLKEGDRAVDSLENMMRDSAMVTKAPNALLHLGGTLQRQSGGGLPLSSSSASATPNNAGHGDDEHFVATIGGGSRNASRQGAGGGGGRSSSQLGQPMPDPRALLVAVRADRLNTTFAGLPHINHHHHTNANGGEGELLHTVVSHANALSDDALYPSVTNARSGVAAHAPMATADDSRSRLFRSRAGSVLAAGGAAASADGVFTAGTGEVFVSVATVAGAQQPAVVGFAQTIGGGGGFSRATNESSMHSTNATAAVEGDGRNSSSGNSNNKKGPTPLFFSQRHAGEDVDRFSGRRTRFTNGNTTFNGEPLSVPLSSRTEAAGAGAQNSFGNGTVGGLMQHSSLYGGTPTNNANGSAGARPQNMHFERSSSAYGGGLAATSNTLPTTSRGGAQQPRRGGGYGGSGGRLSSATAAGAPALSMPRAQSSLARLSGGSASGVGASSSLRPAVFGDIDAINAATLRPKLRFERTDYHNSFGTFQAPPTSAMADATAAARYTAADRGLGSALLWQEDKLRRAARAAAHADAIRGTADRVKENVEAEGARMRRLREARGGCPTY